MFPSSNKEKSEITVGSGIRFDEMEMNFRFLKYALPAHEPFSICLESGKFIFLTGCICIPSEESEILYIDVTMMLYRFEIDVREGL